MRNYDLLSDFWHNPLTMSSVLDWTVFTLSAPFEWLSGDESDTQPAEISIPLLRYSIALSCEFLHPIKVDFHEYV